MPKPPADPRPSLTFACLQCQAVALRVHWIDGQWRYDYATKATALRKDGETVSHDTWSGAWSIEEDLNGCDRNVIDVECGCATSRVDLAKVRAAMDGATRRRCDLASILA